MKKIFLLLIFISSVAFADWRDSAKSYLSSAEQTQQRHANTIEQLEQTSTDQSQSEQYQLLRTKWYSINIELVQLEWQEGQAKTIEEKNSIHEQVLAKKRELDTAFNELKNFVGNL
jgi:hypothetical protein